MIKRSCIFFILLFTLSCDSSVAGIRIVILGSSTAAGYGLSVSDRWVTKYQNALLLQNPTHRVINLAVSGYNTYRVMPTGTSVSGRPAPDPEKNITKALSYNPDVIIINLPTNDTYAGYSVAEQMANFATICSVANAKGVPVWITTTQPRNMSTTLRATLMEVNTALYAEYGDKIIDFWTVLATESGTIVSQYDNGDGVHLSPSAHTILAQRVLDKNIVEVSGYEQKINNATLGDFVSVNFGSTTIASSWNNLSSVSSGSLIYNLIDEDNNTTLLELEVNDAFSAVNTSGPTTTSTILDLPSAATSSSFFGNAVSYTSYLQPTGGFMINRLSQNQSYTLYFFSSRVSSGGDNRETTFIAKGRDEYEASVDASDNTSELAILKNIVPDQYGSITITVKPGSNNNNQYKFFYINAMKLKQDIIEGAKYLFFNPFITSRAKN